MAGPANTPAPTSRRRPPPSGDEEATTRLKLGEMEGMPALSIAEVNEVLKGLEKAGKAPSEIFLKTREYCDMFGRFKDSKTIDNVYRVSHELVTGEAKLSSYERAQLTTLCCDTAEEARTLIPSLEGKISDDELQAKLDEIAKYHFS